MTEKGQRFVQHGAGVPDVDGCRKILFAEFLALLINGKRQVAIFRLWVTKALLQITLWQGGV